MTRKEAIEYNDNLKKGIRAVCIEVWLRENSG